MDSQILVELINIKWLLIGLLICFLILVVVIAGSVYINLSFRRNAIHAELRQDFISEAQRHLDKGRFDELLKVSRKRVSEFPHDVSALWYLGQAHYQKEEYAPALDAFTKAQQLDPTWQKFSIEDYIEEIRSNMKGPRGAASNNSLNEDAP